MIQQGGFDMTHSKKLVSALLPAAFAFAAFGGCAADDSGDDVGSAQQESRGHTEIHTEDDCDPASFGALCRAGFNGNTTREEFTAELNATKTVRAWEYGGGDIRVNLGETFQVDNRGGEVHTFSIVKNFGGGRVAGLNTASGNPTVAPECVAGPNATNVDIASAAGINVTTGANGVIKSRGTFKVQCCIHPWMRSTVTIR
jgi:hypothetical protein